MVIARNAACLTAAAIACGATALLLGGCSYANYPPVEGAKLADTDMNIPPGPALMVLALEWVVDRYPPTGTPATVPLGTTGTLEQELHPPAAATPTLAINLPTGISAANYQWVAGRLNGRAVPLTPEASERLPIYHVSRLWIRGRDAEVDVVYPVMEVGKTPTNRNVYRGVTLKMQREITVPWHVVRQQLWSVGTVEVPPLYFVPRDQDFPQLPPPEVTGAGVGGESTDAPADAQQP